MTRRPAFVYAVLALCLLFAGLGALWLSWTVVERDRAERRARHQALVEENVRLALWRIDSEIATLIATENARPYFDYSAFRALNRAYTEVVRDIAPGDAVTASPLLAARPQYVRLHFQFVASEPPTSPQVPAQMFVERAAGIVGQGTIVEARKNIQRLSSFLSRTQLVAALEGARARTVARKPPPEPPPSSSGLTRSAGEYWKRSKSVQQASTYNQGLANGLANPLIGTRGELEGRLVERSLVPLWIDSELVLVRRINVGDHEYVQGLWLDWPTMRAAMIESIEDLMVGSELQPAPRVSAVETANLLASLPVRLVPGSVPFFETETSLSTMLSLSAVWLGFLVAGIALVVLVIGAMSLSERRAAFVSAVTHELRTPLTTFRMYTEMLSEGMITDEDKRHRYIETLRREAVRLAHLVENVLAYSRIERGRVAAAPEPQAVDALLERMVDRLDDRATQADMTFVYEPPEHAMVVRVESSAVEQILFNLVDNACKYASVAEDRRIHLTVNAVGRWVHLTVLDHGPGIHGEERRSLFSPFSKSAQRAAISAPGVGLGLALCKRLAKEMDGRLTYRETDEGGASFTAAFLLV